MALFFRHLKLLAAGLLLFGQVLLRAQTSAAPVADTPSFTVYAPKESPVLDQLYYLQGTKPPVKLTFFSNGRSVPVPLSGAPKPLVFGVERIDPETRQKTYVPVAEAAWPEATAKALVIFSVSAGASPQVQAVAIDDSLKAFPLRSVRFFNTTGATFLGKVAEFEGTVPPGLSAPHPYIVKSKSLTQIDGFPLALAVQDAQGGARLIYDGTASAWPLARTLVVILSTGTDIQLRPIVDFPPSPPQPTTGSAR
jgi:hypothetical protein